MANVEEACLSDIQTPGYHYYYSQQVYLLRLMGNFLHATLRPLKYTAQEKPLNTPYISTYLGWGIHNGTRGSQCIHWYNRKPFSSSAQAFKSGETCPASRQTLNYPES